MDKKDLKFYEAPATEVVEVRAEGFLCTSSTAEDNPFHGNTEETEEGD